MDGITFIGNATTLIRLGTFTLLTDPNFLHRGQRAYLGKGLWSRRLREPAMQPDGLPPLDAVVLSHLHGDHFDRVARRRLTRTPPVVTTLHAAGRLEKWGFTTDALQNWQVHEQTKGLERLTVESVPGVHARGALGRLLPPVMGSWVEHHVNGVLQHRIYISGDTLTGDHVDEIRRRHTAPGVAVVHLPVPQRIGGEPPLLQTACCMRRGHHRCRAGQPAPRDPVEVVAVQVRENHGVQRWESVGLHRWLTQPP